MEEERSLTQVKHELLKEAKKTIPQSSIEYYSIWVRDKHGKKLRILCGIRDFSLLKVTKCISFVFQSPKEEKDLLGEAIKVMKKRIFDDRKFLLVKNFQEKDNRRIEENLFVLAKSFCLLNQRIYWMDKVWGFDSVEKHAFVSHY